MTSRESRNDALRLEARVLSMLHEAQSMYPGCYVAIGAIIERTKHLFAQPETPRSVWVVENRTSRLLFASKDSAMKFVTQHPASVAGGMNITEETLL